MTEHRSKSYGNNWHLSGYPTIKSEDLYDVDNPSNIEIASWLEAFSQLPVDSKQELLDSLLELAKQTTNLRLRALTIEIRTDLDTGYYRYVWHSLRDFQWCQLPEKVVELIASSEIKSKLSEGLVSAAKYLREL